MVNKKIHKFILFVKMRSNFKKKRICFITCEFPPDKGGISNSAHRITNFLLEEKFEVHVFAPISEKSNFSVEVDKSGLFLYRIPSQDLSIFHQIISLVDRAISFDLFHGFFFFWSGAFLPILLEKKRPLISSIRGVEAIWMKNEPMKYQAGNILRESSWVTSVSTDSLEIANGIENIENKSSFISNSIKAISVTPWKKTLKNCGVIGTVAVFREKKNIPLLIKAYAKLPKSIRTKLLLVGGFDERHESTRLEVEQCIAQLDIKNEVIITGHVNIRKVYFYLKLMNVFVISSNHEGLPNTLLEASALGLPIVSTAVDGIKDVCVNQRNAILVPPRNIRKMTIAIKSILSNESLSLKLSREALKMSKKYTLQAEKKNWINLYSRLLR